MLLVAVTNALYLDHLPVVSGIVASGQEHAHAGETDDHVVHVNHCHEGPRGCAPPAPLAGSIPILEDDQPIGAAGYMALVPSEEPDLLKLLIADRPDKPPRSV
jgi:hypothetical protein